MNNTLEIGLNNYYLDNLYKIKNKTSRVAIIGLGYVGLPLLCTASKEGYFVLGYDVNKAKIDALLQGNSSIQGIEDQIILEMLNEKRCIFSTNEQILADADIIIICVPTPITKDYEPDVSYIRSSVKTISRTVKLGQLIILESTTYPGSTIELLSSEFRKEGFNIGEDLFIAYSPEREDPGNKKFNTATIPKIVGADDENSLSLALIFYSNIIVEVIKVTSTKVAEAVKLTENIFRLVNISLVNELKLIYSNMDIDIWEIIEAAKTKPFGYMPFYPGPGIGGHCIPVDPFYLSWKAKQLGCQTKFIDASKEMLNLMPHYIISRLQEELSKYKKKINNSKILILGVSYKENIDDYRESPALKIISNLLQEGALIDYYDQFIDNEELDRTYKNNNLNAVKKLPINYTKYDAVIICAKHDGINYQEITLSAKLILDTRNAILDSGKKFHNLAKA